jgi:hypothetical protein
MQRRNFLLAIGLAGLATSNQASATDPLSTDALKSSVLGAGSNALMGSLTSKLGVTQSQAEGGVGSILKLAQEKLVKGDFDKIAAAIPGSQKYLDTAKSLGAYSGAIGNLAGLNSSLAKLGIPPETAAKFLPLVTDFVGKVGGEKVGALLKSALV